MNESSAGAVDRERPPLLEARDITTLSALMDASSMVLAIRAGETRF